MKGTLIWEYLPVLSVAVIWKMLYRIYKLLNSNSENFSYLKITFTSPELRELEIDKRRLKKAVDDLHYILSSHPSWLTLWKSIPKESSKIIALIS